MPARPRWRRISIHVLRVDFRSGVEQHLDHFFIAKGGGV
jgi:hypothetical protein